MAYFSMGEQDSVHYQDNEMTVLLKKNGISKDNEKEWRQIVAVLIASLTALTSGFHVAWTSPFLVKIAEDEEYNITESQASYFTILNTVGIVLLSPFLSAFSVTDTIGRKRTLLLSAVPHSLAWILEAFSKNLYVLYAARLSAGFGDALYISALPIYIGEVTTPKVRGVWGNSLICMLFFGQFLMNIIGAFCNVQETSYICLIVPVIFIVIFPFIPETPYFYIIQKRGEEAKKSLRRLRGKQNVEEEFMMLEADVHRQMSESGKWKDILVIDSNRKALIAAVFLRTSQLFCGFYVFTSYTQFIFEKSGGNVSKETSSIIYMGVSFICFSVASFVLDRFGRIKSYIISLCLSSTMLLLEGVYFYINRYHREIDLTPVKLFPLSGMLLFILFCGFGVGTIPTLMLGELFSASVKAKGVIIVTVLFALTVSFTNYIFYLINSYTGLCGPFILFACCGFLSAILTNFLVPETRGKTLEEIQQILKTGFR
ncbi:facilitated trehalose transporter Tret1 [Leptinotarsa decemlineata]|uniref:facilitated trehalose transporter Tret1 n=1 Tax=Leptinotarsa decemlineata TaxID=7539 RepID=UPI003D30D6F2